MKKLLYLLPMLMLASCSTSPLNEGNDLAKLNLRGKVATMAEIEVYWCVRTENLKKTTKNEAAKTYNYYNEAGNLEAVEKLEDEYGTYYQYDESGKLVRKHSEYHAYGDDLLNVCTYNYNEDGLLASIDKTVHSTLRHKYKVPKHYPNEYYYEYEKETIGYLFEKEYSDEKLFMVRAKNVPVEQALVVLVPLRAEYRNVEIYSPEGLLLVEYNKGFYSETETTTYLYNQERTLIEKTTYTENRFEQCITKCKIDSKGNVVEERCMKQDGNNKETLKSITKHNYKYDSHGNWTEHEIIDKNVEDSQPTHTLYKRTFTYHK